MTRHAAITGVGHYVPERIVTNAELEVRLGQPVDAWLRANVGITERRVMADDQATSDLAVGAARRALADAGIGPEEVDLIILATDTPDQISPATSSVVQAKLGADNAGTYDVNAACAGWVTALDLGAKTIRADDAYRHILVIAAYGMTRYLDWSDRNTATLFADGAGAVVLSATDAPGYLAGRLSAHGEYHDALGIYTGGTVRPATADAIAEHGAPHVEFVRKFPATFNTERWPGLVRDVVDRAGLALEDVDLFLFTQLNLRTIEATMAALGRPMDATHTVMDRWGYTGSACIPMALSDAVATRGLRPGDHIVFCASGGGIAMAASVLRWTKEG